MTEKEKMVAGFCTDHTGVSIFDGKEKGKTKRSISSEWK